MVKRILSLLLCASFCCLLIFPCLTVSVKADFYDPLGGILGDLDLMNWLFDLAVDSTVGISNWIVSLFNDDVCPQSLNTNGLHNFVEKRTQVDGKAGLYYVCEYCGKSAGEVGSDSYNSYVDDLPATGYNSDGHLIWNPTIDDFNDFSGRKGFFFCILYYSGGSPYSDYLSGLYLDSIWTYRDHDFFSVYDSSRRAIHVSISPRTVAGHRLGLSTSYFYLVAPVSGVYLIRPGDAVSASVLFADGGSYSTSVPYDASTTVALSDDAYYFDAGSVMMPYADTGGWAFSLPDDVSDSDYSISTMASGGYSSGAPMIEKFVPSSFYFGDGSLTHGDLYFYLPSYELIPSSTLEQYNINTRLSSVYGDVAYYDVNGDLQISHNTTIVNEGDNYYYNPVTNNTYYVNNWNYDYSDRSYHLTTDTGDSTTITYGDQYITIQEGDTVYNIYYYTDGVQMPETHTHEWYQTGQDRPTCTDYGTQKYTCYTCGEQKTEVLPALGHAWSQRGYVDAEYDDEGELLEKAHVLYVCSRCGDEYKDYDGVGPPDTPSGGGGDTGVDSSGLLDWLKDFKTWLGEKLDNLTGGGGDVNIDNDYNFTYTDENGEEHDSSIRDILGVFDWWKDVADIGRIFFEQVSANEAAAYAYAADTSGVNPPGAPSIPVNLGLAQSYFGVDYGGEVEMLDLSWYTPYKSTVDNLISGFLWLAFFWVLFRRAPAIISGAGLSLSKSEDIDEGRKNGRK